MRRFSPLRSRKRLDRSAPLRRRSTCKRARTVLSLWNALSRWVRQSPCARCGAPSDHAHHVLTRAAYPELGLCPENVLPLCSGCHAMAHAEPAAFGLWLDTYKPGLKAYLRRLARTEWAGKPLDEKAEAVRRAVEVA